MLVEGMDASDFQAAVFANPFNGVLIERLQTAGLHDCYLTAGCLFQTVWNQLSSRSPEWGIKDYDCSRSRLHLFR